MNLTNIILIAILLFVVFGDVLFSKFKRNSNTIKLIKNSKKESPSKNFLNKTSIYIFLLLLFVAILSFTLNLSHLEFELPSFIWRYTAHPYIKMNISELIVIISILLFYLIFSVTVFFTKISDERFKAREILFFSFNIVFSLIIMFSISMMDSYFSEQKDEINNFKESLNSYKYYAKCATPGCLRSRKFGVRYVYDLDNKMSNEAKKKGFQIRKDTVYKSKWYKLLNHKTPIDLPFEKKIIAFSQDIENLRFGDSNYFDEFSKVFGKFNKLNNNYLPVRARLFPYFSKSGLNSFGRLFRAMRNDNLYLKSFEEFASEYFNEKGSKKLHTDLFRKKLYSKSFDEFKKQFGFEIDQNLNDYMRGLAFDKTNITNQIFNYTLGKIALKNIELEASLYSKNNEKYTNDKLKRMAKDRGITFQELLNRNPDLKPIEFLDVYSFNYKKSKNEKLIELPNLFFARELNYVLESNSINDFSLIDDLYDLKVINNLKGFTESEYFLSWQRPYLANSKIDYQESSVINNFGERGLVLVPIFLAFVYLMRLGIFVILAIITEMINKLKWSFKTYFE